MKVLQGKRAALWAAVVMLLLTVAVPSVSFGQGRGRGRGQSRKSEVFRNGHDARDGRWDGRGPRGDRDDRDDRDDDDDYYRRNRDDRYGRDRYGRNRNGNVYDRTDIQRQARSTGYQEGLRAGQDDRYNGRSRDYSAHNTYQDATAGYQSGYGDIEFYRRNFREGYRQGYEDGYRNRNSDGNYGRRSGIGGILGDVLGRP